VSQRFHVAAEQHVLIANIESAVGDDRVCPGRFASSVGPLESTALEVLLLLGSMRTNAPSSVR
jgi:hypothetical protein